MKLLLVEDEVHLSEALKEILSNNGYEVDCALDGKSGLNKALLGQYDMLLLDIMLPQLGGLDILKRVREFDKETPAILLTARGDVSDKILGLDYGADDYIQKPFNTDELLARIRAHIRRTNPIAETTDIKYGDVTLSKLDGRIFTEAVSISLSQKEVELFDYFIKNNTIVVPFEKIAAKLGITEKAEIEKRTAEYISILKNKLTHVKSCASILTIHGIGYKLISPIKSDVWKATAV